MQANFLFILASIWLLKRNLINASNKQLEYFILTKLVVIKLLLVA
jgi:hypothetical protein